MTLAKAKRKGIRKRKAKKVGSVRVSLLNLSKHSDTKVWDAIRRATQGIKLKQHPNLKVTVTGSDGWHGGYCPAGGYADETPLVKAHITPDESKFPQWHEPPKGTGYLPYMILDTTECLIGLLAHEFCHAWQREHKHHRKHWRRLVWGARGVYSERETSAHAIRKVREYRRSPERQRMYQQKVSEAVASLLPPLLYIM